MPSIEAPRPLFSGHPRLARWALVIAWALISIGLAALAGSHAHRRFDVLEQKMRDRDLQRLVACVNQSFQGLKELNQDWASWDEAYAYVAQPFEAFEKANLAWPSLHQSSHVQLLAILDLEGNPVWRGYRLETAGPDLPFPPWLQNPGLVKALPQGFQGILLTPQAPLMVVARPILDSRRQDAPRGLLVMGRAFQGDPQEDLELRLGQPLQVTRTPETPIAGVVAPQVKVAPGTVTATVRLPDLGGQGALVVSTQWERDIHLQGVRASRTISLSLLLGLLVVGATALAGLRWYTRLQERTRSELDALVQVRTAELHAANRALEEASLKDPLTHLANRRMVTTSVPPLACRAQRAYHGGIPSALEPVDLVFFLLDLDHFKSVNDTFGHGAGDAVLRQTAERLRQGRRESDLVARWGGEEFLVVAHGCKREHAPRLAEGLLASIRDHAFQLPDGQPLQLTVSVGWCAYPFPPKSPSSLTWEGAVEIADLCLYAAKRSGRNGWVGIQVAEEADPATVATQLPGGTIPLLEEGHLQGLSSWEDPALIRWH